MTDSPFVVPKECVCFVSVEVVSSLCKARFTRMEQGRRKPNSCKTSGEITRNWSSFKNITIPCFLSMGVLGWRMRFQLELEMS